MAEIIGAIASSHSPTIGFAFDKKKQDDPVWAPIFKAYEPIREWLAAKKPDVLFMIFNDHVTSFAFDHYSNFALGVGDPSALQMKARSSEAAARKGTPDFPTISRRRWLPTSSDLSFFQDRPLDHGFFSPLCMLCRTIRTGRAN
jgi:gallate dioxygenase